MSEPLVNYVRNYNGDPVGCVVAIADAEHIYAVGWSQCNPKDRFSKKLARDIAIARAKYGCAPDKENPAMVIYCDSDKYDLINDAIYCMYIRAERYFLNTNY